MIVEYIRYRIPQPQHGAFERAYADAQASLSASEYCMGYELSHCVEESESYILRIEWTSKEQHERRFRSSPEFRSFFAAVRPYLDQIDEMRHYELTPVRSQGDDGR